MIEQLDDPAFERDTKSHKIKPLLHNLVMALERPDLCGGVVGRDEFKDELLWRPWERRVPFHPTGGIWTADNARPFKDADYVRLQLQLRTLGFGPGPISTEQLRQAVNYVGDQRTFDSAVHWINQLPAWDGVARIDTFCSTYLGSDDTPYTRAVGRYWWTAHAGRILNPGCQADMAIVMISDQGTGKTSSLRAIAPTPEQYVELNLMDRDEDLCRAMRGKSVGEMAELKGLAGRDMESVKAWISRRREEWVPKYLEFTRTFPRRLVLIGTSNQEEFLADETGNRRWLPMMLGQQDVKGLERDKIQLWAEAAEMYFCYGIVYREAESLAKMMHEHHLISDAWEDSIREWLVTDDGFGGGCPMDREHLFISDVLKNALGMANHQLNMSNQFRAGKILRKMGFEKIVKKIDGKCCKVWARVKNYT